MDALRRSVEGEAKAAGKAGTPWSLLLVSMVPLALGICLDFYLISRIVFGAGPSAAVGAALFAIFLGLWFVLPRLAPPPK